MARKRKLPAEPVRAVIESMSHDGRGVARIDGKAVFIHSALPGEEVMFTYTGQRRRHDEGIVQEVLKAAAERVEPRCPHFGVCGGCSLQHMDSDAQIKSKEGVLLDAFQRIGHVTPEQVLAPLVADRWGYRRKARLGAKYVAKKGKVLIGFRERSSAFVADLNQCHVLHHRIGTLIPALSTLIDSFSIRSRIPQIEVSMGDEICVLIFRLLEPLVTEDRKLLEAFGQQHRIVIYLQEGGPETVQPLCQNPPVLSYQLPSFDLTFQFLPNDFTQVNSALNRAMIDRAVALLNPQPHERVLDLYCGIGNFTLPLARRAARVTGVEGDSGLVQRARENATRNGLSETRFFTANLYEILDQEPWLNDDYDCALLDPPRSGSQELLHYLPRLGCRRVLYVSCNPSTLARDAGVLTNDLGYRLKVAGVMDMFPHTAHVESIALFEMPGMK